MKKNVIYKTQEEAERKTGFFHVYDIKITKELGDKILNFMIEKEILVYDHPSSAGRAWIYYTTKFSLRKYGSFFYISYRRTNAKRSRYDGCYSGSKNNPDMADKITPTLNEMYFMIAKKYPKHILYLDYSDKDPETLYTG